MRQLTVNEVHAQKVRELGLDSESLDLATSEAIAGALRRVASFLCPCSATTLTRAVVQPLRGLVSDIEKTKELVEATLDAMVGYGDLLEQPELLDDQTSARLLYAALPSFAVRNSGMILLFGGAAGYLPSELERRIELAQHIRRITPLRGEDLRAELRHHGLREISFDTWQNGPKVRDAAEYIAKADRFLDSATSSRDIPGLKLLDPARPVRYYLGRWVEPKSQTGRFVARRQQAYGADLWSYVQLASGHPQRMIDLPLRGSHWRACDEAWYLQMAIDAHRGLPQQFQVKGKTDDTVLLEFFSPVPAWARRRWDAIGEPVASSGSLFAYRIRTTEIEEEYNLLRTRLWLEETGEKHRWH